MRAAVMLIALALAAASTAAAGRSAQPGAERDARLLAAELERVHPDLFQHVTRKRFHAEVDTLARRAGDLTRDQLLVGLMRIAALPGPRNGHTGIFPLDSGHRSTLHLYPLRLYAFRDGVYVVDAADRPELVGTRLAAISGVPMGRVSGLVRPLVPHDNESTLRGRLPSFSLVAEVLDGLGIEGGAGPRQFTFERADGELVETTLNPVASADYVSSFPDPIGGHDSAALPARSRPMYLAQKGRELWLRKLVNGRVLYVGYNTCLASTGGVAQRLERLARSRRVERIAVDLRLNRGGDNTTYGPLLAALASREVNRNGRLYVLIGRATFSAAGNFATEVDGLTRAVFVGEPTGGGVNQYGDSTSVTLPHSGWTVRIATVYHQKGTASDRRLAVDPDIPVLLESSDFFAGRDPALTRALRGL